jgi:hypothetical protein
MPLNNGGRMPILGDYLASNRHLNAKKSVILFYRNEKNPIKQGFLFVSFF